MGLETDPSGCVNHCSPDHQAEEQRWKGGATGSAVEPGLVLSDPDEDYGVEVICEGKTTSHLEAEGVASTSSKPDETWMAPSSAPSMQVSEDQSSPWVKLVLSKQQMEEAAKMTEQRKRFDNQKYHAGEAAPGNTSQPSQEIFRAHESIMGVNASFTPRKVQEASSVGECLPGGVFDDDVQTEAAAPAYRNNHQLFDDDEEMLMKEILDSVDA